MTSNVSRETNESWRRVFHVKQNQWVVYIDRNQRSKKENEVNYKEKERKDSSRQSLVLAVINQKGGVGKSTTAVNLGAALGEKGYKVLLIDLDAQGNATTGVGYDKTQCETSTYDCLVNDDVNTEDAIAEIETKNMWLLPATIDLAGAETKLVDEIAREFRLSDALKEVRDDFDFVLIDCPPSLGLLTVNALAAADQLIIPIQCEFYALEGLSKIIDSKNMVKKRINPNLDIFGVVITMYDKRTTLSKDVAKEVENVFGDKLFKTKIPRTVRISEAPSYGEPITEYDSSGKVAEAYRSLAKEVIKRYKKMS